MFEIFYRDRVRDLYSILPKDLSVSDIAETLAKINRFAGRTPHPYSVAQHAVLTAKLAQWAGGDEWVQYEALHHDDVEAFFGDIIKPLKDRLAFRKGSGWSSLEQYSSVEDAFRAEVLAPALGLAQRALDEVGVCDRLACKLEQVVLQGWESSHAPSELLTAEWRELLRPMHWCAAQRAYEELHRELMP